MDFADRPVRQAGVGGYAKAQALDGLCDIVGLSRRIRRERQVQLLGGEVQPDVGYAGQARQSGFNLVDATSTVHTFNMKLHKESPWKIGRASCRESVFQ